MFSVKKTKELTTKEIAEKFSVAERVARRWCEKNYFPNARKETTPRGDYWLVPETDTKNFQPPKIGRPRGESPSDAARLKRERRAAGKKN